MGFPLWFSNSIVTLLIHQKKTSTVISNHSAAINCHRMSPTLKSTGSGYWGKVSGGRITNVSQILTRSASGRDMELSYAKHCVGPYLLLLFEHNVQCESKKSPLRFTNIFPNCWEFLINFYAPIMRSYLR